MRCRQPYVISFNRRMKPFGQYKWRSALRCPEPDAMKANASQIAAQCISHVAHMLRPYDIQIDLEQKTKWSLVLSIAHRFDFVGVGFTKRKLN